MRRIRALSNTSSIASEELVDESSFRPSQDVLESLVSYIPAKDLGAQEGAITLLSIGTFPVLNMVLDVGSEQTTSFYGQDEEALANNDQQLLQTPSGIKEYNHLVLSPRVVQDLHGKLLVSSYDVPCKVDYKAGYIYANRVMGLHSGYSSIDVIDSEDDAFVATFHLLATLVYLKQQCGLTFADLSPSDIVLVRAETRNYRYTFEEESYDIRPLLRRERGSVLQGYLPAIFNFSKTFFQHNGYRYSSLPARDFVHNLDLILIVTEVLSKIFSEKAFLAVSSVLQDFFAYDADKMRPEPSPIHVLEELAQEISKRDTAIAGSSTMALPLPSEESYDVDSLPAMKMLKDTTTDFFELETSNYRSGEVRFLRPKGAVSLLCCNKELHQSVNAKGGLCMQGTPGLTDYPQLSGPQGLYSSLQNKANFADLNSFTGGLIGFGETLRIVDLRKSEEQAKAQAASILQDGNYLTASFVLKHHGTRTTQDFEQSIFSVSDDETLYTATLTGTQRDGKSFFAFIEGVDRYTMYNIVLEMVSTESMIEEEEGILDLAVVNVIGAATANVAWKDKENNLIVSSTPSNYQVYSNLIHIADGQEQSSVTADSPKPAPSPYETDEDDTE
jgi:hypothetical protein